MSTLTTRPCGLLVWPGPACISVPCAHVTFKATRFGRNLRGRCQHTSAHVTGPCAGCRGSWAYFLLSQLSKAEEEICESVQIGKALQDPWSTTHRKQKPEQIPGNVFSFQMVWDIHLSLFKAASEP